MYSCKYAYDYIHLKAIPEVQVNRRVSFGPTAQKSFTSVGRGVKSADNDIGKYIPIYMYICLHIFRYM
jgi:hypothetical protein